MWPIFLLLALAISYFALGSAFWFGGDTCTCEPPCNLTQRIEVPVNSACDEAPFGRLGCAFPSFLTLLQTDNFPTIMYPSALCRVEGSPRFVLLLTVTFVFVSHLTLLNVFLATYFEEFRRHRKWRERALQKRERRTLCLLYMILVGAVHKREGHVVKMSELLQRTMRGEALLTMEPWLAFLAFKQRSTVTPTKCVRAALHSLLGIRASFGAAAQRACCVARGGEAIDASLVRNAANGSAEEASAHQSRHCSPPPSPPEGAKVVVTPVEVEKDDEAAAEEADVADEADGAEDARTEAAAASRLSAATPSSRPTTPRKSVVLQIPWEQPEPRREDYRREGFRREDSAASSVLLGGTLDDRSERKRMRSERKREQQRQQFEERCEDGEQMNILSFWELFDDIAEGHADEIERRAMAEETAPPEWLITLRSWLGRYSSWALRLGSVLERSRSRCRSMIGPLGEWRGVPRYLTALLFVTHLLQVIATDCH